VKTSPQPQVTFVSTYAGWISGFIFSSFVYHWVRGLTL